MKRRFNYTNANDLREIRNTLEVLYEIKILILKDTQPAVLKSIASLARASLEVSDKDWRECSVERKVTDMISHGEIIAHMENMELFEHKAMKKYHGEAPTRFDYYNLKELEEIRDTMAAVREIKNILLGLHPDFIEERETHFLEDISKTLEDEIISMNYKKMKRELGSINKKCPGIMDKANNRQWGDVLEQLKALEMKDGFVRLMPKRAQKVAQYFIPREN